MGVYSICLLLGVIIGILIDIDRKLQENKMGVYVKGNPKEGEYKLIKTTDGFVLEGKDIAYACIEIDDELMPPCNIRGCSWYSSTD